MPAYHARQCLHSRGHGSPTLQQPCRACPTRARPAAHLAFPQVLKDIVHIGGAGHGVVLVLLVNINVVQAAAGGLQCAGAAVLLRQAKGVTAAGKGCTGATSLRAGSRAYGKKHQQATQPDSCTQQSQQQHLQQRSATSSRQVYAAQWQRGGDGGTNQKAASGFPAPNPSCTQQACWFTGRTPGCRPAAAACGAVGGAGRRRGAAGSRSWPRRSVRCTGLSTRPAGGAAERAAIVSSQGLQQQRNATG